MIRQKPVGIVDPGIAQHLSVGYAGTAVLLGDGILHGGVAAGEGAGTSVGGVLVVLVIAGPVVLVAIVVVGIVVAVVVDIAEIVIVVVIRGTQPPPHRRSHINRDTPNFF